ncbi:hypothetical protein GOBAR_AA39876 [Gossypium barbadense]|uniref:Uncharacterized protein n=1 Tax=Gossypium barbadense TaxID=3634 RepID=A0A2P5VPR4_GOSBA|nr:hypothetical protein GOBAR_AA39876 [Gossypium barbadense]
MSNSNYKLILYEIGGQWIKNFEVHDPHRVGRITVDLQGRVNDCRALTYRQDIKAKDIEKYKTLKLPTRQWGYVVISTPDDVLDHEEAIRRNVGGQCSQKMPQLGSRNPQGHQLFSLQVKIRVKPDLKQ